MQRILLILLAVSILGCAQRISCPNLSTTYESTGKPSFRFVNHRYAQESELIATASRKNVPAPSRPSLQIPEIKRKIDLQTVGMDHSSQDRTIIITPANDRMTTRSIAAVENLLNRADTSIVSLTETSPEVQRASRKARWSLWLGIGGNILNFIPFGLILGIPMLLVSLILGSGAFSTLKRNNVKKRRLEALFGMIISGLAILFVILVLLAFIFAIFTFLEDNPFVIFGSTYFR